MKKFITFCKSYLAEILFAFLTLLLICGFTVCWLYSTGVVIGICGAMAMVLEILIAYGLSNLSLHRHSFRITLYLSFILWVPVFIIGIILSTQANKELLASATLVSVAFCALFSDMVVSIHWIHTEEIPIATVDECDDD